MEAGCMKKVWKYKDSVAVKYHWNSTGQLLATGVCVRDDYQKHFPPEDGTTKVYSTIADHEVRQVDAKKMTLSLDFILTMQWLDSRIHTNLPNEKSKGGGITLSPTAVEQIWSPDLRILNRQSFKAKEQWASLITTRILTGTDIYHLEGPKNTNHGSSVPTVEMKYDVKKTFFNINQLKKTLKSFSGVQRRMTKLFSINKNDFYDDYAHHPTEISSILEGVYNVNSKRKIISVFEPHRYSRVMSLKNEFSKCFSKSKLVIMCPLYAAGEKKNSKFNPVKFGELIMKNSNTQVIIVKNEIELSKYLRKNLTSDEIIIGMGAGFISKWMIGLRNSL